MTDQDKKLLDYLKKIDTDYLALLRQAEKTIAAKQQ